MKKLLFSVLFILSFSSHGAGRIFHDDFEAYSIGTLPTTKWSATDRDLPEVVNTGADGGAPHGGSRQVKLNWCGTTGGQGDPTCTFLVTYWFTGMQLPSWSYTSEFLIRLWWRTDANKDVADGAKLMRLGFPNEYFLVQQDGATHEVVTRGADGTILSNNFGVSNVDDRQWHKVEIYVKQADSGGIFRRWDNDALQFEYTGDTNDSANNKYYPWYVASNWSENPGWEHDAVNNWYVDDVEIFSDTGTGGTGLMSDGTITQASSDTTPPVVSNGAPSGVLSNRTSVTMVVTTDETATCKYDSSSGITYSSMANTFSTTGTTSHSTTLTGLSGGTSYNRYVRCSDSSNNPNISDYTVSFSINLEQPTDFHRDP